MYLNLFLQGQDVKQHLCFHSIIMQILSKTNKQTKKTSTNFVFPSTGLAT